MTINFITGASSGIGRSLSRQLALQGETVIVVARRKLLLDTLVEQINQDGGRAVAIACDVTDRAQVRKSVAEAEALFGSIDRLIACAGGGKANQVENFAFAEFEQAFALNVGGTAHCIEAVLPGMLERGGGHLVAVSSLAGYRGLPGAAAYSAAKAALSNMMESLRIDLDQRISVTLITPGFVRTKASSEGRRPLQIDLETASRRMTRAIIARKRHYAFPWALAVPAAMFRILPAAMYDRLLIGMARRRRQGGNPLRRPLKPSTRARADA